MTAVPGPVDAGTLLAGVDVGGSKIAVLIADRDLAIRGRHVAPTEIGSEARAIEQIADALDAALADAGATRADLAAIGVGVPGRVDPATGIVTLAVNLHWHDLALGPLLATRFGVMVALENDVRAAAAGLYERGVVGRRRPGVPQHRHRDLRRGGPRRPPPSWIARSRRRDRPCRPRRRRAGLRLRPERLLRGAGLGAGGRPAGRRGTATGRQSSLRGRQSVRATDVYAAAVAGDPLALEISETVGRHVAHAVHELVMTYDVRRVARGRRGVGRRSLPRRDRTRSGSSSRGIRAGPRSAAPGRRPARSGPTPEPGPSSARSPLVDRLTASRRPGGDGKRRRNDRVARRAGGGGRTEEVMARGTAA